MKKSREYTAWLPNAITILRILLAVPLLSLLTLCYYLLPYAPRIAAILQEVAIGVLIVGIITDYLDGWLARQCKCITNFGAIMDPIADKVIINSYLIALSAMQFVPFWVTVLFILRDTLVDASRLLVADKKIDISATRLGKLKTTLQMIGIIVAVILSLIFTNYYQQLENIATGWRHMLMNLVIYLALAASLISGTCYIRTYASHYLGNSNNIKKLK